MNFAEKKGGKKNHSVDFHRNKKHQYHNYYFNNSFEKKKKNYIESQNAVCAVSDPQHERLPQMRRILLLSPTKKLQLREFHHQTILVAEKIVKSKSSTAKPSNTLKRKFTVSEFEKKQRKSHHANCSSDAMESIPSSKTIFVLIIILNLATNYTLRFRMGKMVTLLT